MKRPMRPLPEPELASLPENTKGPEAATQTPWWAGFAGTLDERTGVVAFPSGALPPCGVSGCHLCTHRPEGA